MQQVHSFAFVSVRALHCIGQLTKATVKFAAFCCSAAPIWRRKTTGNFVSAHCCYCLYEAKLCLCKLIRLLYFSSWTPLHCSAIGGHLEVTRLLVESKADVAARTRCFSPPPSHHLSLTIRLAAVATLHSNWPSKAKKTTLLHTCAASARRNDAPPSPAAPLPCK